MSASFSGGPVMSMSLGGAPLSSSANRTPNTGVGYFNTSTRSAPSGWAEADAGAAMTLIAARALAMALTIADSAISRFLAMSGFPVVHLG